MPKRTVKYTVSTYDTEQALESLRLRTVFVRRRISKQARRVIWESGKELKVGIQVWEINNVLCRFIEIWDGITTLGVNRVPAYIKDAYKKSWVTFDVLADQLTQKDVIITY